MIDVEEKSAYFIAINDYGYDKEQQQKAKQRGKEFIKLVHEENMTPFDALVKLNKIPKDFYIREDYIFKKADNKYGIEPVKTVADGSFLGSSQFYILNDGSMVEFDREIKQAFYPFEAYSRFIPESSVDKIDEEFDRYFHLEDKPYIKYNF